MIILRKLEFSNWFSYGENVSINLDSSTLTQLIGKNGAGKSSIPIIIEETLYNKNSKGIKKSELANRDSINKNLFSRIEFTHFSNEYIVEVERRTSTKATIFCNGKDISSHTSTGTFKTIESIIGLDFKTFSQLLYQSSTNNLSFLTDTDSQRKIFLINLFNLGNYKDIESVFKTASIEKSKDVKYIQSEVFKLSSVIKQLKSKDFEERPLIEVPNFPEDLVEKRSNLKSLLEDVSSLNSKISKRESLKKNIKLVKIEPIEIPEDIDQTIKEIKEDLDKINETIIVNKTIGKGLKSEIDSLEKVPDNCTLCGQPWPEKKQESLLELKKSELEKVKSVLLEEEGSLKTKSTNLKSLLKLKAEHEKLLKEEEKLLAQEVLLKELIDEIGDASTDVKGEIASLNTEIKILTESIESKKKDIERIVKANNEASSHNSKIGYFKDQLEAHEEELLTKHDELYNIENSLAKINVLKDAFGAKGLVAYKLEYLAKGLEREINKYLDIFTYGNFHLKFILENDKLGVNIESKSEIISINSLSAGELSRVNICSLLAIRKLMSEISDTKINLLFLDEITGVLDDDGKEQLINVLLEEKGLNTFIIAHDYEHPLIPKLSVIKKSGVSKIIDGY